MTDRRSHLDRALRRLVCNDWVAAIFAIAFYLQLHTLVARQLPAAPEDALFAAALLAVVALRFRYGALNATAPRQLVLMSLPWMLAGVLSGIDAHSTAAWGEAMVRSAAWLVMGAMLATLFDSRRSLLNAAYGIVGGGAFVGALNLHQFLTSSWDRDYFGLAGAQLLNLHGRVEGYRASGPVDDANYHAQFLLPLLAIAVERTWSSRGRSRLLASVAVVCLACGLALTYSRGAMLVFAVLLPVAAAAALRWRVPIAALALTLAAALAAIGVAGPALFARAGTVSTLEVVRDIELEKPADFSDQAVLGRLSENLAALQMMRDHPWNGVGLGNYPELYLEYSARIGLGQLSKRGPHNLYLEAGAETGIVGLLGLLFLVAGLIAVLVRTRRGLLDDGDADGVRRLWGIAMGLAAFFLDAVFLHLTFQSMLWALLAIGFASPVLRRTTIHS